MILQLNRPLRRLAEIAFILLLLIPLHTLYASSTATVPALKDSVIDPNNSATNYDSERLEVTFSNFPSFVATRRSLLQFDLSSISEPLTNALLSVTVVELNLVPDAQVQLALYASDDGWNEESVTWDSRPVQQSRLQSMTVSSGFTGTIQFNAASVGTYLEDERTGDRLASFYLLLDGGIEPLGFGGNILFANREDTSAGVGGNEPTVVFVSEQDTSESTYLPHIQR